MEIAHCHHNAPDEPIYSSPKKCMIDSHHISGKALYPPFWNLDCTVIVSHGTRCSRLAPQSSHWGWVPAVISRKEPYVVNGVELMKLTLKDDPQLEVTMPPPQTALFSRTEMRRVGSTTAASNYYDGFEKFEVEITVDPEQLKLADHDDIKLRNLPNSYQLCGDDPEAGVISSPST